MTAIPMATGIPLHHVIEKAGELQSIHLSKAHIAYSPRLQGYNNFHFSSCFSNNRPLTNINCIHLSVPINIRVFFSEKDQK
jgi:hypothetical protein